MSTRATTGSIATAAAGRRPLATIREVADYLQVDVQTVYGWRKRKTGDTGPTAKKVGGQLRYDWNDVDAWLAQQQQDAA